MDYKKYIECAYDTACKHNFHVEIKPTAHWLMLVITEISEAVEADRKGKHANVEMYEREANTSQVTIHKLEHKKSVFEQYIKDTVEDEFADICIRLFDLCAMHECGFKYNIEALDIDTLIDYFTNRYANKSFTEKAFELCNLLTQYKSDVETFICTNPWERWFLFTQYEMHVDTVEIALAFVQCWAKSEGVDLEWHIEHKLWYNKWRGSLHGKKY